MPAPSGSDKNRCAACAGDEPDSIAREGATQNEREPRHCDEVPFPRIALGVDTAETYPPMGLQGQRPKARRPPSSRPGYASMSTSGQFLMYASTSASLNCRLLAKSRTRRPRSKTS